MVAAAASSIALARRRPSHVPAAIALAILAAVAVARGYLMAALHDVPRPVEGAAVYLLHAERSAELLAIATTAGLCLAIAVAKPYRVRALALMGAVWGVTSVAMGAFYPSPLTRGPGLHRFYFAADLFSLFVATAALVYWMLRSIAVKQSPDSSTIVALALVALDGAILLSPFSPWQGDPFATSFQGPQVIITLFFAIFTVAQVIAWKFSTPPG
jgi:hypothetical protein